MTSRQRGWLLPPAAFSLVAGVLLGRITSGLLFPAAAFCIALLSVLLLKGWFRFAACLSVSFVLGICSGFLAFHPSLPPEGTYEVRGIISDEISTGSFGQYRIYLSDVSLDNRSFSGGAYWTFYADEEPEGLYPGREAVFQASLYHPEGVSNPNGYNFRDSLLQRGVLIGLYGKDELVLREPDSFSFSGFVASLRHRLSSALIRELGQETGSYASALLFGMRSLIPSEDRQAFSRLGIAHILSVSGFHVGVLIGAFAALFRLLRLRQPVRIVLYALLLFFYSALCGMNQPVIRASLFLLLAMEGRILNRPRSGLHILSAVLIIMTLFSPVQVTSASFQLSFCAVFGIVWFSRAVNCLNPFRNKTLRTVAGSFLMSLGIQLSLLFPELLYFQRLPLLVFLVNLPAMLVFSVLIALFWISLLLLPLPGAASAFSGVLSAVTGFLLDGVRSLGSLPGLTLWIHTPTWLTFLGLVLVFAGLCYFLRIRGRWRISLVLAGVAAVVVSLLPAPHPSTEYIQFSAGNADAALIWDQDRVIVLDAGEADGTLSSFLRARRLVPDAVILTHLHADHAGGLLSMMEDDIPIRLLYLPAGADVQQVHPDFLQLLSELENTGTEIRWLSRGDVLPLPSGDLTVLWPENGKVRPGQEANNYSLVSRITLKETVLLQTGDLTGAYESYCASPANILKAAHHGSASSTLPGFLSAVSPDVILLSCRSADRLESFRGRSDGIPVYGTPESGALTVRFEENSFLLIPFIATESDGGT